ncbi:serine/threonine-protein phosphatase 4 regulatory subunit 3B-like isoform X9 [Durio zibethinus]|uniref:Serine/threonine-protein phosphatase 4 regulatory subunit 3B-like isoform X9 n=1 Tax=Durio zibethinus TaxID=66656 RepID=A0A6P6A7A8_DURZI|nr:serine/threonine-protein phosphatase 4 regulatory subunit 3B-like isoform X9 [Durio zibethinus]
MGAHEKSQGNANSMQRVKVYRLNEDGKWDDQGTGHVAVDYLERSEEMALFVFDEEDNETLLLHRISPDDIYRKQEDTIISWRDSEYSTELALSFQENTGCSYIWDNICNVQRSMHFSSLNNETFHTMNSELRELPAVELSTLPIILKTVTESGLADQMRLTELILNDQDFFQKLMELFRICEDLENIDGLHMIFKIIKGIILLNSPQIFEKIFGDELIMDIIGSLEYDPDVSQVQHYRNFLKEHIVFKEAIVIKNPMVLSKIHQTYRVGYLKDVVLSRVLDEATVASLNSIIHSNNATVISLLKDDSTFIQELFASLRSPTTSSESKKNLDEHLISHFVKNDLLKPVVDAFVANGNRYNLLNSAVLELFEYIRKENLKLLVKYIVDSFWSQLVKFEYLTSVHSLKVKYEQCLENCGTKTNLNALDPRKRIDERALEKEEEDYFNEDSDEDDTASASHTQKVQSQPVLSNGVATSFPSLSPRSGGLVDYDDDDEDEDYRPPPKKQTETSEEDEGTMESLRFKRKLTPKEKEHELAKKQRLGKSSSKSRDSVFAALCSTLSQAVLPSKKTTNAIPLSTRSAEGNKGLGEENHKENESGSPRSSDNSSSVEDNHIEKEPSGNCSDCLHDSPSDNRQLSGEDCPLIPPKSSPEMAVNGS